MLLLIDLDGTVHDRGRTVPGAAPGSHALVLGSGAVADDLRAYGKVSVTGAPGVTHVVVGDCREVLSYPLLDAAFRAVRDGAELLALQRGRYFRGGDGDHLDTGAIVAAIEYATEVTARLLGKPGPDFVRLAAGAVDLSDVVVVGDDRGTDVAMARAVGARSVQVRTGKYGAQVGRSDLPEADDVVDSLAGLPRLLSVA